MAAERVVSARELNRALLARQLLLERVRLPIPRAVERIGGLQTEYAPSAYIGLWSRLAGFERAELTDQETERQRLLTFAIVGAGPTGVEMAGAIAEVARQTLPPDFRRIDPRAARIVLIEAAPRILPALPERLSV